MRTFPFQEDLEILENIVLNRKYELEFKDMQALGVIYKFLKIGACKNGHYLTPDNVRIRERTAEYGGGTENICVQCNKDRSRKKNEERRAAVAAKRAEQAEKIRRAG